MKLRISVFAVSLLCASFSFAQHQQAESLRRLPSDIASFLDKKYPGWKFAPLTGHDIGCYDNEVKSHPALTSGDFNGDGKNDFAVEIVQGGSLYAIEFLSKGNGFATVVLFRAPANGKRFGGPLITEKKGKQTSIGTVERIDSPVIGDCGDVPARYIFRNGRIKDETPSD